MAGLGKTRSGASYGPKPKPSRHSGGTSGNLSVKGHKTQTPVLPYLPSEPSHIPGVAGATRSSAHKTLEAQHARLAAVTHRSAVKRKRTTLAQAKRVKSTEAALKAAKPVQSAPKAQIAAPPAKLKQIQQANRANAKEFAAEQPKAAKQLPGRKKPSYAVPQPKLSPTLQHPRAALAAKQKLKRAKRVLARTTRRSDGSTEGQVKAALHKRGYNRVGAAGVIGNFKQESGPELNTTADDGSGNGGLAGFTASPVSKADLQAFAASHGLDWTNPKVQTAFMDQHIDPATKAAVNASKSPQQAAVAFQEGFERPGIPMQENRERYAVEAFQKKNLPSANPKAVRNYQAAVKKAKSLGINPQAPNVGKPSKHVVTRFKAANKAAQQIERLRLPYVWGGGHNSGSVNLGSGVDCSGAVSYVLQKMGVKLPGGVVSGDMGSYLKPGPGAVTVFYNPEHTFMRIGNRYFGTSGSNPGGGAGFIESSVAGPEAASGRYSVGHVAGLGQKVALQLGIPTFPGMTVSPTGATATINSGEGTTVSSPGFSAKPIQLTPTQKRRRTFKRLKQLGVGVPTEPKEATEGSKTLRALEKKYGA